MRIIGLRSTRMKAAKNFWRQHFMKDAQTILTLQEKGHAEPTGDGWRLTGQGIQQLKLQIGEFHF